MSTHEEYKILTRIGHCWVGKVCKKYSLIAEIVKMYPDKSDEYMWEEVRLYLYKDLDNKFLYQEILDYISGIDGVEEVKKISSGYGTLHVLVKLRRCLIYSMLDRGVLNYTKEIATYDGKIIFRVRIRRRTHLMKLLSRIQRRSEDIEVLDVKKAKLDEELTILQDRVVRIAWALGYYEIPKKVTIKEIAKALNISPATVHEILKRAEKKIISRYVRSGYS